MDLTSVGELALFGLGEGLPAGERVVPLAEGEGFRVTEFFCPVPGAGFLVTIFLGVFFLEGVLLEALDSELDQTDTRKPNMNVKNFLRL